MSMNYNLLRRYARGFRQEQLESPAAGLQFYAMVSSIHCTRMLLMAG